VVGIGNGFGAREAAARGEEGGVGRCEETREGRHGGIAGRDEEKSGGLGAFGFRAGVGDGKNEEDCEVGCPGGEDGCRQEEVDPVAVGPVEDEVRGFHWSSEVAMTVG
jgi:hypothetical protein